MAQRAFTTTLILLVGFMPTTIFGSQFFSASGDELRAPRTFSAICATQDIDLATHLLPAGDYSLTVNVVMGQINIYVPDHIATVVDGTVLFGTADSRSNGSGWKRFLRFFRAGGSNGTPAIAFPDTSGPVRLRIRINGFLGAVRIYRLEREAEMFRPGMIAVGA